MTTVTHLSWDPTSVYLCTGDTKGHVTAYERCDVMTYEFKERVVDLFNAQGDEVTALTCNPYYPHQPAEVAVG